MSGEQGGQPSESEGVAEIRTIMAQIEIEHPGPERAYVNVIYGYLDWAMQMYDAAQARVRELEAQRECDEHALAAIAREWRAWNALSRLPVRTLDIGSILIGIGYNADWLAGEAENRVQQPAAAEAASEEGSA